MKILGLERYFSSTSEMRAVKALLTRAIRPHAAARDVIREHLKQEVADFKNDYTFWQSMECSCVTI